MEFKGSVQKYIRGEHEKCDSVRNKLNSVPKNLKDISKIVPIQEEIYNVLKTYYKRKGLQ